MCPRPPYFYRMPNISLRVSPDVRNCPTVIKSRDSGGGPYYPSGPYSACLPTLFIFGRKNGRLLLLLLLFVATLSDFGLLFFLIEALIELRKMLLRKKIFYVRFGNYLTPKVPRFCRFTKMQF